MSLSTMDNTLLLEFFTVVFLTMTRTRLAATVRLASVLSSVIVKANLAVPGTITSSLPRLGNRISSCWLGPIVVGLWVMTTDLPHNLDSRGGAYKDRLRPNLREAIVFLNGYDSLQMRCRCTVRANIQTF